jgi:predicted NBD/HSP70 family sugar kinase
VGNGIGSGIIINRHLYLGAGNFSVEIGFMTNPENVNGSGRNYIAHGGYMEYRMSSLVDFSTGQLKKNRNSIRRKEFVSILSAVAVNHVAVLNPGLIVFGGKVFDKDIIKDIKQQMGYYLHKGIMPRICQDLNKNTGLEGLIEICRENITTAVHLVQSTGLPEIMAKIPV